MHYGRDEAPFTWREQQHGAEQVRQRLDVSQPGTEQQRGRKAPRQKTTSQTCLGVGSLWWAPGARVLSHAGLQGCSAQNEHKKQFKIWGMVHLLSLAWSHLNDLFRFVNLRNMLQKCQGWIPIPNSTLNLDTLPQERALLPSGKCSYPPRPMWGLCRTQFEHLPRPPLAVSAIPVGPFPLLICMRSLM